MDKKAIRNVFTAALSKCIRGISESTDLLVNQPRDMQEENVAVLCLNKFEQTPILGFALLADCSSPRDTLGFAQCLQPDDAIDFLRTHYDLCAPGDMAYVYPTTPQLRQTCVVINALTDLINDLVGDIEIFVYFRSGRKAVCINYKPDNSSQIVITLPTPAELR